VLKPIPPGFFGKEARRAGAFFWAMKEREIDHEIEERHHGRRRRDNEAWQTDFADELGVPDDTVRGSPNGLMFEGRFVVA
jgi:hypothetical protein